MTWQPIPGFEGRYEASSEGQIRSLPTTRRNGGNYRGAIKRLSNGTHGYLITGMTDASGVTRLLPVHLLVASAFLGPRPEGWHTCHNDGNKHNNAVANLRYDTQSGNEIDKVNHGANPNSNKTHCPQGHPYDELNTRLSGGRARPRRNCRACERAHDRLRYWRKKSISV